MGKGLAFCVDRENRVVLEEEIQGGFSKQDFQRRCVEKSGTSDIIVYTVTEFGLCLEDCLFHCYLPDDRECRAACLESCRGKMQVQNHA